MLQDKVINIFWMAKTSNQVCYLNSINSQMEYPKTLYFNSKTILYLWVPRKASTSITRIRSVTVIKIVFRRLESKHRWLMEVKVLRWTQVEMILNLTNITTPRILIEGMWTLPLCRQLAIHSLPPTKVTLHLLSKSH